jgi:hypothetical protein
MDTVIVITVVALAFFFTARNLVKSFKGEKTCSCGGCSCSRSRSCAGQIQDLRAPDRGSGSEKRSTTVSRT